MSLLNKFVKLLGFITRTKLDSESKPLFHCHVFKAQPSADEICTALSKAANIALSVFLDQEGEGNANVECNDTQPAEEATPEAVKAKSQDMEQAHIPEAGDVK